MCTHIHAEWASLEACGGGLPSHSWCGSAHFTFDDASKLQWDTEPKNHGTRTSGSAETESFFALSLGYLKGSGTFHGWTTFGGTTSWRADLLEIYSQFYFVIKFLRMPSLDCLVNLAFLVIPPYVWKTHSDVLKSDFKSLRVYEWRGVETVSYDGRFFFKMNSF